MQIQRTKCQELIFSQTVQLGWNVGSLWHIVWMMALFAKCLDRRATRPVKRSLCQLHRCFQTALRTTGPTAVSKPHHNGPFCRRLPWPTLQIATLSQKKHLHVGFNLLASLIGIIANSCFYHAGRDHTDPCRTFLPEVYQSIKRPSKKRTISGNPSRHQSNQRMPDRIRRSLE
jgi:hypothetical protein